MKGQFIKPAVPCRAVFTTISRDKGLPVSREMNPALMGILPAEEALLGVGLVGMGIRGMFARCGIYTVGPKGMSFRMAINYNAEDGSPNLKSEGGPRRFIAEAELALVNWVQGGLFNAGTEPGHYHLRVDRVNGVGKPDLDEERDLAHMRNHMPNRQFFAAERRVDAAIDMFNDYLELDIDSPERGWPTSPAALPMISARQLPEYLMMDGRPVLPIVPIGISPKAFTAFATKRATAVLKTQNGDFREVKAGLIKTFAVIDSILKKGAVGTLDMTVERSIASLTRSVHRLFESAKLSPESLVKHVAEAEEMLDTIRTYAGERTTSGQIRLFSPGQKCPVENVQAKITALFEKPLFVGIRSLPMQIVTDYMSNGEFPVNGSELFQKTA